MGGVFCDPQSMREGGGVSEWSEWLYFFPFNWSLVKNLSSVLLTQRTPDGFPCSCIQHGLLPSDADFDGDVTHCAVIQLKSEDHISVVLKNVNKTMCWGLTLTSTTA